MKSGNVIKALEAMGDIQRYIDSGYTLSDLIASGVFNQYGLGNIFNKTYGPYAIGSGATVTVEHEDDESYQRIIQISYENGKGERIVEPSYNYAISMSPATTTILKIRSSGGADVLNTYITVLFRKSRTRFDNKENGVLIFNNAYIVFRKAMLDRVIPEYGIINAYCSEQNLSYRWVNGQWSPVLDSDSPEPPIINPEQSIDINYNRLCHCEYYRKEVLDTGKSLILVFPPVIHLSNIFALVSQFSEATNEHLSQYECQKRHDRFIVTNKSEIETLIDIHLWIGYPSEQSAKEYYCELIMYIMDTETLSIAQEPHTQTSIDGLLIDTTQLGVTE